MTQAQAEPKLYSFDEFISWYPEQSDVRYELHDGVILEIPKPKGKHSNLTGSLFNLHSQKYSRESEPLQIHDPQIENLAEYVELE